MKPAVEIDCLLLFFLECVGIASIAKSFVEEFISKNYLKIY